MPRRCAVKGLMGTKKTNPLFPLLRLPIVPPNTYNVYTAACFIFLSDQTTLLKRRRVTNWKVYPIKEKAMPRSGKIGQLIVPATKDAGKVLHADLPPPHLQHGTHQSPDHSPKEPVGLYPVNQGAIFLPPTALTDRTNKGLCLGIPLGKRRKIFMARDQRRSRLHPPPVQRIGKEIRPISQERILFLVYIISVLPADGVKPAMRTWSNRMKIL